MFKLTDRKIINYLCNKYNIRMKHGLGQNFLCEEWVLEKICNAAESDGETVLEIGPGFGVLTSALATKAKKVVSVEIDTALLPVLSETLAGFDNIEIINADFMKCSLRDLEERLGNRYNVAANLPYYITTPILTKLLEEGRGIGNIVVMLQKEVADRICAKEGGKDYGAVSVFVQYYCVPEIVCHVPASSFTPPPKVDSCVLKLRVLDEPAVSVDNEKNFFRLVKAAFAQRRKILSNALANSGAFGNKENVVKALAEAGLEPNIRGEALSLKKFAELSNIFSKNHCISEKFGV